MKNYNPLLSVIVPVYNVEEYIEECLLSVVKQDYKNIEVIVVNDGSTDRSALLAAEIAEKYSCIHLYNKTNGGLSDARNYGIEKTQGDFVTFVDSDDVLLGTDIYQKIIDCFAVDSYLDVVQYNVIQKWESPLEYKRNYPFRVYSSKEEIAEGYLKEYIHVSCCDKVFKKNIFEKIRFPLNQQSEDIAIIPQLIESISKLQTTDIGYYGYRYREGSISTAQINAKKIADILNSYHQYLSYTYQLKGLDSLSIQLYTNHIWDYCSAMRQQNQEALTNLLKHDIFLRINLFKWLYLSIHFNKDIIIKTFISCVLGPQYIIIFQKLFTKKEQK